MENSINILDSVPAPNRHSKVTLLKLKLFSCSTIKQASLSPSLRVDPRVGDDPERMRGLPVGVFCARKLPKQQLAVVRPATAESQLAAALMGGSWEGIVRLPSACDA